MTVSSSAEPKTAEEAASTRLVKAHHSIRRVANSNKDDQWDSQLYRPGVKLDLVRGRLITESFKQTDGQPWVIRRAKAFAHYLENVPLFISPGQRFLGGATSRYETVPFCPEKYSKWVRKALHDRSMRSLVDEEELAEVDEILDWWEGRTVWDHAEAAIPQWLERHRRFDGTFLWAQFDQGPSQSMWVQVQGIDARIREAEKTMEALDRALPPDYVHRRNNLEAMLIALRAARAYARRNSDYCRERAAQERDSERKAQLEEMARINDRIAIDPPRDFREALQHFLMLGSIHGREEDGNSGLPRDRFDVVFRPFWEKSKAAGMTYDEGIELVKWWLLKYSEDGVLVSPLLARAYEGQQRGICLCIGGMDEEGNDVTNDLTYMLMDAFIALKTLNEPQLTLRVHPGTPKEVILKALEMLKLGMGYPSFFNDTVLVPLAAEHGLSLDEARSYIAIFCVNQSLPGNNICLGWAGWLNWAKVLLWALNKGIDPKTGEQKGAVTKDPLEWTGYQDMMEAYLEQLRFFGEKQVRLHNFIQQINKVWMGKPFSSAFSADSLERGLMGQEWGHPQYMCSTWPVVGPINVANSMAAIRKYVFEERKVTMADLIEALRVNWEDFEEMRQLMLSAPKFGNDDDYVDCIANEVQVNSTAVMESFRDYWGAPMTPNGSNASTIFGFSWVTGATPDGRRKQDMLADGTLSPQLGTDQKGPLAVLRSASKIDTNKTYCHLLNQRLTPDLLEGEVGQEAFYAYIKSWMEMGISHIQFNVVDTAMLLDAQAHPDKYQDLLVRVAGYSAYFVDLNRGMQDGIIARTEHERW